MSEDVLKITITAAGEQAKAELQKVAQALSGVTKESHNVAAAHANHAKEAEKLGKQLDSTVKHLEFMATGFHNFRAIFAGGAAAFGFVEIINQTMRWDEELQRLSQVMNGNVLEASRWMAIGEAFHVPVDNLILGFRTLSLHIDTNSKVLRDMGIATEDSRGKLLPFDQVLAQVNRHFQENATATNIAGQAQALFGRGGLTLLPALIAQSSTIKQITDDAEKLGLIINGTTLMSYRQLEAEVGRAGTAFHALELAIGHGLLPALAAAGQAIASFIVAHLEQLKQAIANVISFIIGFFEAFTGGTFQVSALAQALGSAAQATDDFGTASGGAANSTKALTDALQDQIKAIDEQIKGLQEVTQLENYQDSLRKLQQKATDDKKKVDLDYAHYQENLLLGNQQQAMTVLDSLAAAQQTATNDQLEIKKAEDDEARRLRINSLNDQKAKLQEQIAAIQDAATKGVAAIGGAMAGVPSIMGAAGAAGGQALGEAVNRQVESYGHQWGDKIKTFLTAPGSDPAFLKAIQWVGEQMGKGIVAGIVAGMSEAIKAVASPSVAAWIFGQLEKLPNPQRAGLDLGRQIGEQIKSNLGQGGQDDPNNTGLPGVPAFALGGIVPGPVGQPRLAVVHGGEEIRNQAQQAASRQVSIGPFYIGSVDSTQRVDELRLMVRQELAVAIAS